MKTKSVPFRAPAAIGFRHPFAARRVCPQSLPGVHFGAGRGGPARSAAAWGGRGTGRTHCWYERTRSSSLRVPAGSARPAFRSQARSRASAALARLAIRMGAEDVLFCFQQHAAAAAAAGRVVTYLQAPYLVRPRSRGGANRPVSRAQHALERLWFRMGVRNCDEVGSRRPAWRARCCGTSRHRSSRDALIDDETRSACCGAWLAGSGRCDLRALQLLLPRRRDAH
jgi:hypothetical protein